MLRIGYTVTMSAQSADLPWADYSITLKLQVRKFFCINAECKRRIFTERIAAVVAPWARRTQRMALAIGNCGFGARGCSRRTIKPALRLSGQSKYAIRVDLQYRLVFNKR